ncbi:MAG TPA: PQQ-dependent sugar dehydrogenase [Tepidisphaeraceae bacterium]|jgi:glucose/arabinose dehydrogenase|nr:PQQ-dependent sugar dehydrogenase [Tepidisphaeraceae bacterium]HEV8608402.1 PQQ-dependent sugar dehydrogenase [Tepidisphaeraceae bacterium]
MRTHFIVLILSLSVPAFADAPPKVKLQPILRGLDRPIQFSPHPDGRQLVVEQVGRVRFVENGKMVRQPYLDLTKKVYVEYECGLLSIVFHPDFAKNGLLYANYTAYAPNLKTFITEYKTDPKSPTVDITTERIILTIDQPFPNHNGGQLAFGPDGMLYIGMGDGGQHHNPSNSAQNPKSLLGKMLRIDVTPREKYAIPKDNPFVNDSNYLPEIYALGMRNPWRFCFDKETGLLYAADVGQDTWEEVDIIEKGGNYGWRIREGNEDLHPIPNPPKTIDPIFQYNHNKTAASITGGCVYHGSAIPALKGWYIFGDYSIGKIWAIKFEPGKPVQVEVLIDPNDPQRKGPTRPTQPSAFGEDASGEVYLLDINGPIYKFVPPE